MKISFVIFSDDIPKDQSLCEINNAEIKFGTKKVTKRSTIDVDVRFFIALISTPPQHTTYSHNEEYLNLIFLPKYLLQFLESNNSNPSPLVII